MLAKLRPRQGDDDAGISLVELIVTMSLMVVLSMVVTTAVIGANRVFQHDDDESAGLADVKTVVERMGRDVREARGVATGATGTQLQLWIDYNSDYKQESDEVVSWRLTPEGDGVHYDVVRAQGSGAAATEVVEARTLIVNFAFSYCSSTDITSICPSTPDTATAQVVQTKMTYDTYANGKGSSPRIVAFQDRLRNKGDL